MERHVTPRGTYLLIFAALLALTATTVAVSTVELGRWHIGAALLIASIKAVLVVLFFMHVLHSTRLVWLAIGLGVFCLGILLFQTFSDYLTRTWLDIGARPAPRLRTSAGASLACASGFLSPPLEARRASEERAESLTGAPPLRA